MKKTMTKKLVHTVYAIIGSARLNELKKTDDKVAVLRVLRQLRRVAVAYEDDAREATNKLKPDGYDEQRAQAALYETERNSGKKPTAMADADYQRFLAAHLDYTRNVATAMRDIDEATVELDFEPVAPDVLRELMDANQWTVDQFLTVEDVLGRTDN